MERLRRESSTMVKKFNVEEFEHTEMEMDAKLANKAETNPLGSNDTGAAPCRRTGLDRRWIPSKNHHPERRRGGDRRAVQQRSFLDSIGLRAPGEADHSTSDVESVSEALESESPAAAPSEDRPPEALAERDRQVLPERK
jgi:hypothetical protein